MTALEKVVGGIDGWRELRFVFVQTGSGRERFQRRLFLQLAGRCAASWSKNWPKYVKSEEEAQLDQTAKALEVYSRSLSAESPQRRQGRFPVGPNVVVSEGEMNSTIRSFDEAPADGFLDLDTGRLPNPPANLLKNSPGHEPSRDLLAWAEREGVDLINIKIKSSDGKWFYAFKPLGMKVWRIEQQPLRPSPKGTPRKQDNSNSRALGRPACRRRREDRDIRREAHRIVSVHHGRRHVRGVADYVAVG